MKEICTFAHRLTFLVVWRFLIIFIWAIKMSQIRIHHIFKITFLNPKLICCSILVLQYQCHFQQNEYFQEWKIHYIYRRAIQIFYWRSEKSLVLSIKYIPKPMLFNFLSSFGIFDINSWNSSLERSIFALNTLNGS